MDRAVRDSHFEFLSVSQFAAREGVSRIRVLQLLAARRIDGARKIGRHWAIPVASEIVRRSAGRPSNRMKAGAHSMLRRLARKYVWWLSVEEALRRPELVIAQTMELGDFRDTVELERSLGREALVETLRHAASGRFSGPSWTYWHYRLGLARPGRVPGLPKRALR